jgi:hypothetical protein
MSIDKFYIFSSKFVSSTLQVHMVGSKEFYPVDPTKSHLFDEHKLLLGDYNDISFPVVFKQKYGKKRQDILDTGTASLFLISDKMKVTFEDNKLTGWKAFEVKILNKQGQEIQGYHGLSVTGRCGKINYSQSEIIEKRLVPEGPLGKYYRGLYVGLDKWDGSDFFLPEKNFGTVITNRAADILKNNKFTNIRLENLAEIEIPDFALQN